MTICIVDDDLAIRAMLAETLEDEGYAVVTAADGHEALVHLKNQSATPCVILLDLMMPRMNGWEFCAAQQQDARLATIPIVVLSARIDIEHVVTSPAIVAYLPKPIDLDRLLQVVAQYCVPLS